MHSKEFFLALQLVLEYYVGEEITTERLENDYSILAWVFDELDDQQNEDHEN